MTASTLAPQSLEAEQAVIGAVLLDPDTLLAASDIITPEDFYHEKNKLIYAQMLDIYHFGNLDIVALIERLQTRGMLERCGGISYLTEVTANITTTANIRMHCRIVQEKALLRKLSTWAAAVSEQSRSGVDDIHPYLGKIEAELVDISQSAKSKTSPYATDILLSIQDSWDLSLRGESKKIPPSEFLEGPLPGYYPKHLIIIGGYTGKGKSKFLNQLLVDAMRNGGKIAYFSLEDSRDEKMMALISCISDVPYKALITGRIQGYEEQIADAQHLIRKWNPIIYDDVRTIDDIRLKAKKHKIKDGIDIIALDYVQNLQIKNSLYETMADAASKLFSMVNELSITGLVVSQIDNDTAKKESNIIGLKGAGELAAAAHAVLWLTRVKGEGKERHIDCTFKKNRAFGETPKIELEFTERWTGIEPRNVWL